MMKEVILAIAEQYKVSAENVPWPEVSLFAEHGDIVFNSDKLNKIIDYECKHDFIFSTYGYTNSGGHDGKRNRKRD